MTKRCYRCGVTFEARYYGLGVWSHYCSLACKNRFGLPDPVPDDALHRAELRGYAKGYVKARDTYRGEVHRLRVRLDQATRSEA